MREYCLTVYGRGIVSRAKDIKHVVGFAFDPMSIRQTWSWSFVTIDPTIQMSVEETANQHHDEELLGYFKNVVRTDYQLTEYPQPTKMQKT